MSAFMDRVMAEPVSLGGFTWSYGFLLQRLGNRDMMLFAASNRPVDPNCFDTRELPESEQLQLWDACGTGDLATINHIMRATSGE